ncbi:ABC transporter ATP-binding protein [Variovorax defluvii]|uniref:ABC transporter ATP-binding protein n=1 Tax=Variovorax defluvii TaxID=913761 RepID=A0ABP8HG10_9BURK
MTALACRHVGMRFGAFAALTDVSLRFERSRFYGLIGPNGAGKTTLINVLSGALQPTSGEVELDGRPMHRASRHAFARQGLARSFQTSSLFNELGVRESLVLALQAKSATQSAWRDPMADARLCAGADAMLGRLGMRHMADERVGALAHGWQRLLDLGIAFIGDAPIVLLDEPFAGIGHSAIGATEDAIRELARGRTVVMVEHNMSVLMRLAEDIVVLAGGQVLARGTAEEVRADAGVRRAYLGEHA